jgi:hypothetical protein
MRTRRAGRGIAPWISSRWNRTEETYDDAHHWASRPVTESRSIPAEM